MDKMNHSKNVWAKETVQRDGNHSQSAYKKQGSPDNLRLASRQKEQPERNLLESTNSIRIVTGQSLVSVQKPGFPYLLLGYCSRYWLWGIGTSVLGAMALIAWLLYPSFEQDEIMQSKSLHYLIRPVFDFFSKDPVDSFTAESSPPPAPPALSAEQRWQNWKAGLNEETGYLRRNEALVMMLKRYGLNQKLSSDLVLSVRNDVDLTRLRAEDPIELLFLQPDEHLQRQLVGFQIRSREKTVNAYLYQGRPKSEIEYHELDPRVFSAKVEVLRSLYQDGLDQGIPGGILLEMFNRYSFDINFQSDIQRGTRYELVYTMIYNEKDEVVSSGEIFYANIILANGRSFPIFEYTDLAGKSDFFNTKGRSTNKALLLIPVNGAYVSSYFGYRRDPILGRLRFHRGTDYAAPTGTPIKAGGNGKIITRGWSRVGYGYHIIIRHRNGYDTLYGHMSRFRSGYKVGSSVRQGDIIGYVGSTGRSTGPHVHYEVRRYGKPISIKSLHLKPSRTLAGTDLELFEIGIQALQARFQDMLPDLYQIPLHANALQNSVVDRLTVSDRGAGGSNKNYLSK